jgi:hypothetical protein
VRAISAASFAGVVMAIDARGTEVDAEQILSLGPAYTAALKDSTR